MDKTAAAGSSRFGLPRHKAVGTPTLRRWIGAGIALLCLGALCLVPEFRGMHHTAGRAAPAGQPIDVTSVRARADRGEARAQWELGGIYARAEGVTQSYAEAAKWYRRGAEQGCAEAQAALGELCQAGQGVPKDLAESSKWFRMAASQGNVRAQYSLGFMCETGRGLPQDHVQAAKWYLLAAEQGEPLSQFDLGQRYDLGVGVPVDPIESLKWLTLAAAQGQTDAAERLKIVKRKMTRQQISEALSRAASFSTNRSSGPQN